MELYGLMWLRVILGCIHIYTVQRKMYLTLSDTKLLGMSFGYPLDSTLDSMDSWTARRHCPMISRLLSIL